MAYWKTFDSKAVGRMLADQQGAVVDLGCHCTVYDDAQSFARVEVALAPEPNVFLIEPSSDAQESIKILRERRPHILRELDYNERYVRDESNRRLAKHVVYTQGKNPKQTADEIVASLGATPLAHITRNAYCPCQSGRRFKVCCGRIGR